eukprot:gb/GECH01008504.1/.p1 GENE.gb/GECH01008504.1/~~gb/GECH01008504.1/.p1  ORF type:complete len:476 (+),score=105.53 gb/GECH01008504.1/:1-1428(+)
MHSTRFSSDNSSSPSSSTSSSLLGQIISFFGGNSDRSDSQSDTFSPCQRSRSSSSTSTSTPDRNLAPIIRDNVVIDQNDTQHSSEKHSTSNSRLFAWGNNDHGAFGNGAFDHNEYPATIDLPISIRDVVVGSYHTLLVTQTNDLYVCGKNNSGQLGVGIFPSVETPTKLEFFQQNVELAIAGWRHSAVLTTGGKLYAWGYNQWKQCNNSSSSFIYTPHSVPLDALDAPIKDVQLGDGHNVILTKNGTVWTFGYNGYGQLGHSGEQLDASPQLVRSLVNENVVKIVAGYYSTMFFTDDGKLYFCGLNNHFQAGLSHTHDIRDPVCINIVEPKSVTQIAFSMWHLIYLTDEGKAYFLGNDNFQTTSKPKPVTCQDAVLSGPDEIVDVAVAWHATYILTRSGRVYAWGRNNEAQLGVPKNCLKGSAKPRLVSLPERVNTIKARGSHIIAYFDTTKHQQNFSSDIKAMFNYKLKDDLGF